MAPVITSGGTVTSEKIEAWEQAHDIICIMLKSRCERNARSMIKDKTNAKDAWTTLEKFKPWGSDILNSTFKKIDNVTLAGCNNDSQSYVNKFIEVLEEFDTLAFKLHFDENWKIYRSHSGLSLVYNSCWEQYNQTHNALDNNGEPIFDLDYTITRFINIITNPTSSITTPEV